MTDQLVHGLFADPGEPLSEVAAEAYVATTCFKTGPPGRVGLELEFLVVHPGDWSAPVDHRVVTGLIGSLPPLPALGTLTFEPGGQVELSTRAAPCLPAVIADASADLAGLRAALAAEGLALVGAGTDPLRPPRRVLDHPRYAAMEAHLDRWGAGGRTMMCSTAAVQVTVEAGHRSSPEPDGGIRSRWQLLHAIGPVLVAAFANSPYVAGRPCGWASGRQAAWHGIDPSRTSPVGAGGTADPAEAYARYALDALVLLVRRPGGGWTAPVRMTFRDWVTGAWRGVPGLGPPTVDDLAYHLTTLFPPVRARGAIELRCVDAQAGDGWRLPPAVVTALLDDPVAAGLAREAAEPVAGRWEHAARTGVADPALATAAVTCLTAAADALTRGGCEGLAGRVGDFVERYPMRGRCPADDQLDRPAWAATTVPGPVLLPETLESSSC